MLSHAFFSSNFFAGPEDPLKKLFTVCFVYKTWNWRLGIFVIWDGIAEENITFVLTYNRDDVIFLQQALKKMLSICFKII